MTVLFTSIPLKLFKMYKPWNRVARKLTFLAFSCTELKRISWPNRQIKQTVQHCTAYHHQHCIPRFHNFFNWTMTYRTDSDVYRPYGWLAEAGAGQTAASIYPPASLEWRQPPPAETGAKRSSKTKMIAWIVSNCNTHSNRWEFVCISSLVLQKGQSEGS